VSAGVATSLAVIAFVMALIAMRRTRALRRRLEELERLLTSSPQDGVANAAPLALPTQAAEDTEPATEQPSAPSAWAGDRSARRLRVPSGPDPLMAFGGWIRANWIFPVAGAALVMAAVFLVQYSIEAGLLSPQLRIALAGVLGAGLIATGEAIRRRWGDEDGPARIVPSTLSGAGIFALLAAILAAFHLYAMLSPPVTLIALAATAVLAMILGWAHGPFLAALGLVSGTAAPFLLGDASAPSDLLYAYFGAVALLGLGTDGFRRWGWVSVLAVGIPQIGGLVILLAGAGPVGMALLALTLSTLSMAIPFGALVPGAQGPTLWECRSLRATLWAPAVAMALGAGILVFMAQPILSVMALIALALIHAFWTARAPALADQALIPALAIPAAIAVTGWSTPTALADTVLRAPWAPVLAVALAGLAGLVQIMRSEPATGGTRRFWALLGVGLPMGTFVSFELFWAIGTRGPGFLWPAGAMALAVAYAGLALWTARRDAGQGLRLGLAVMAAFTMIALSLMLTLSLTALTTALAVLMVAAAAMDKRFDIPAVGWFLVLSSMALGYRIIISPGLSWMLGWTGSGGATDLELVVSVVAALSGPAMALWLIRGLPGDRTRDWTRTLVETGLSGMVPIVVAVLTARFVGQALQPHAQAGLQATVLMALAWVHARRAALSPDNLWMRRFRTALSLIFGAACVIAMAAALTVFSPLFTVLMARPRVIGWPLLNDLLIAYAFPAMLLLWILLRAQGRAANIGRAIGFVLLAHWIGLAIRHVWQGQTGLALSGGFAQGELYTYTVALLVGGALSLALALRLGRRALRIAGLALIGIAAAKAFVIDASGLTGLLRAGAFLALGLSLVGLAWLNAWVAARIDSQDAKL